jgi:pimeloyl-ACP methyl ester carboxylesterase
VEAWLQAALEIDVRSPNGVLLDLGGNPLKFNPSKIVVPTLMIYGAEDPFAPPSGASVGVLFRNLATADKKLAVIPGGGHGVYLEQARDRWYQEVLLQLELGSTPQRPLKTPAGGTSQPITIDIRADSWVLRP